MNALDTPAQHAIRPDQPHGLDADAWFTALDNRAIQVGPDTCIAQVAGVHAGDAGLWIQVSCLDDPDVSVVLFVTAATTVDDVLHRLRTNPPKNQPLEIIGVKACNAPAEQPSRQPVKPVRATRPMARASVRSL